MSVNQVATATEIVGFMFDEIESGETRNSFGERTSDYYSFLADETGESMSLQLTEETCGLQPEDYFYMLLLVDNITSKDCDVFFADKFTKESVLALVESVITNCIADIQTQGKCA